MSNRFIPGLLMAMFLLVGPVTAETVCLPSHAVVFIYHHVGDQTPVSTSVSPEIFEQQLAFLADKGFRIMDLPTVVSSLKQGRDLPDSVVVLTFDDGYESVYREAFPRLKKRGWPFTVFVCPQVIDRHQGPVMTWDQLREMAAAGATVASHGLHHGFMNRPLPGEDATHHLLRLKEEIKLSQKRIGDEFLPTVDILAYPYGEYSPAVQTVVESLGWSAFGQQSGAMGPESDFTCLPRFPMAAEFADLESFADKVSCLPLPTSIVVRMDPNLDPATAAAAAPKLTLLLETSCLGRGEPAAYGEGQESLPVQWLDRDSGFLQIQAAEPLPAGRSRYNITAPVPGTHRWYWFSQLWINGRDHQH